MRVKVKQKHIDEGICGSAQRCVVAKAIMDVDNVAHCSVGTVGCTVLFNGGIRIGFDLPPVAIEYIRKFDLKQKVEPIEFDLITI